LLDVLNSEARSAWPLVAGGRAGVLGRPRVGLRLGWVSIFAGRRARTRRGGHRWLLGVLILTAAAARLARLVPWQEWLAPRGRALLDFCPGLIGFVALLVLAGGANLRCSSFSIPFIAVVQVGGAASWLAALGGALVAALIPLRRRNGDSAVLVAAAVG
jgi:hypothetical protein